MFSFLAGLTVSLSLMDVANEPGAEAGVGFRLPATVLLVVEEEESRERSRRPDDRSGRGSSEGRPPMFGRGGSSSSRDGLRGVRGGPPSRPGFGRGGEGRREERPSSAEASVRDSTATKIADLERRVTELLAEIRKLKTADQDASERRPSVPDRREAGRSDSDRTESERRGPRGFAFGRMEGRTEGRMGPPGPFGFRGMSGFPGSRERGESRGDGAERPGFDRSRGFRGMPGFPGRFPDMRGRSEGERTERERPESERGAGEGRESQRRPSGPRGFRPSSERD